MSTKMGGQDTLSVLLLGDEHLSDLVMSRADGGNKLAEGLAERVTAATRGATSLAIRHEERPSLSDLAEALGNDASSVLAASEDPAPDVVVLSPGPDVFDLAPPDDLLTAAASVLDALKQLGSHVIWVNASTVDPGNLVSNYHGIAEPFTRSAQRLDLALLQLSISHGISIIDADRILAEMGAAEHVTARLDYSPAACDALCDEVLRVLADYGFFERRPVMAQVGQREDS